MSGNKLEDKIFFKDGHSFGHLPNLTELELDHNLFTTLPTDALVKHKNLKKLNVGFNKIIRYDPEFTEQIKTGLEIEFEGMLFTKRKNFPTKSRNLFTIFFFFFLAGNPLHCNCLLRPISYWLASVGRDKGRAGPWERAKCKSPQYYEGFAVDSLIEEQLICDKTEEAAKFKANPDIQFRDIKK